MLVCGIAETVIIKLDRQREFFAERGGGEFFSFKTGIPGGLGEGERRKVKTPLRHFLPTPLTPAQ